MPNFPGMEHSQMLPIPIPLSKLDDFGRFWDIIYGKLLEIRGSYLFFLGGRLADMRLDDLCILHEWAGKAFQTMPT